MFVGALQVLMLILGLVAAYFPDRIQRLYQNDGERHGSTRWPTDFTADIRPVKCHSHNDYWREIPVHSALQAGCTSVEADVWLFNDDLYVGHTESSLTPSRTFQLLYVQPLKQVIDNQNPIHQFQPTHRTPRNGVFDTNAEQSLVLLIDFKTNGDVLFTAVQEQLEPLRQAGYLSYFNGTTLIPGPLTVVVTGNAPFHKVVANMTYRDMFFDAPLEELGKLPQQPSDPSYPLTPTTDIPYDAVLEQTYLQQIASSPQSPSSNESDGDKGQGYSGIQPSTPAIYTRYNSFYASVSLLQSISSPFPYLTSTQTAKLQRQISGAHTQGLNVRYWDIPAWPVSWRHYLWRSLLKLGVDYLNVDDLLDATKGEWMSSGLWGRFVWGNGRW